MRRTAGLVLGAAALVGLAACRGGTTDLSKEEAAIRANSRAVAEAEAKKDADAVMPYWAEDAVVHFNGESTLKGRDAIGKMYRERLPRLETFRAETNSIEVSPGGEM